MVVPSLGNTVRRGLQEKGVVVSVVQYALPAECVAEWEFLAGNIQMKGCYDNVSSGCDQIEP